LSTTLSSYIVKDPDQVIWWYDNRAGGTVDMFML